MDEREALAKLIADERFYDVSANVCLEIAGIVLAAGYRLPTTGGIAAELRGWEQGRDAAAEWLKGRHDELARQVAALTPPDQMQRDPAGDMPCDQCGRPIRVDTVVDKETWAKISPTGDSGGQLCASCMVERLAPLLGWVAARLVDAHDEPSSGERPPASPRPIFTAPTDGTMVLIWAAPRDGLPGFWTAAAYHEDAGWCVDELREATLWLPFDVIPKPQEPTHDD